MWIAKPLRSLSPDEQSAWCGVLRRQREQGHEAPLAQTLAWGRAIEAVSGQVFAVFSPEESVGGLVFATMSESGLRFECVNGPLLDWDDAEAAKRQLATFATAISRLSTRFASMSLRPRWQAGDSARRLAHLPIEAATTDTAATLKIALNRDLAPEAGFGLRLRRTLRASERAGVSARWEELNSSNLVEFALAAQAFGRARGFTVPPVFWFRALTDKPIENEDLRFGLVTAGTPEGQSGCQLLIALHAGEAHYLFGHEWRAPGTRAALSPSAMAHRLALQKAAEAGMHFYDLNGYLEAPPAGHPYAGVSAFKSQFEGTVVRYEVPDLVITS